MAPRYTDPPKDMLAREMKDVEREIARWPKWLRDQHKAQVRLYYANMGQPEREDDDAS